MPTNQTSPKSSPRRIQRRRTRGYRLPATAVYVGRPTKYGNPYRVGDPHPTIPGTVLTRFGAVRLYEQHLRGQADLLKAARLELAGRDLACWCAEGLPCHADVLLQAANEPTL